MLKSPEGSLSRPSKLTRADHPARQEPPTALPRPGPRKDVTMAIPRETPRGAPAGHSSAGCSRIRGTNLGMGWVEGGRRGGRGGEDAVEALWRIGAGSILLGWLRVGSWRFRSGLVMSAVAEGCVCFSNWWLGMSNRLRTLVMNYEPRTLNVTEYAAKNDRP